MKINEVIERQLTKEDIAQIIEEGITWNGVKNAIAGGLIALSAFGITDAEAKAIADMTPEEVKQELMTSLDDDSARKLLQVIKGEYKDDQEIKQDVQQKQAQKAKPEPVKKAEPVNHSGLSQFSVKGIQFGMTLEQFAEATGAVEVDMEKLRAEKEPDLLDYEKSPDWITLEFAAKAVNKYGTKSAQQMYPKQYDQLKPYFITSDDWKSALANLTIGGKGKWTGMSEDGKYIVGGKGTLGYIQSKVNANDFEKYLQVYTKTYGKPIIKKVNKANAFGRQVIDTQATWNVKDVVIQMNNHSDINSGYITFGSKKFYQNYNDQNKKYDDDRAKDF